MAGWLGDEEDRTEAMAKNGQKTVNDEVNHPVNTARGDKVKRVLKGYRPQIELANQLDILVTRLKIEQGKKGPELIDEAIKLLLNKYKEK